MRTSDAPATDRRSVLQRALEERLRGAAGTGAPEAVPPPRHDPPVPPPDRPETALAAGRAGYVEHLNPRLARLLAGLGLDRSFVHGQGTELVDEQGRTYLDFAGAYGALPLGHRPAAVWAAVHEVGLGGEPIFVQPSVLPAAGALAARLAAVAPAGLDRVTFVNSGAEAVEIALKIVRSATGRMGIVSTDEAFHGKTLGALSATGRGQYQHGFGAPAPGFSRVPFGDADALDRHLAERRGEVAAFLVEPVQGEGGVRPAPRGYLTRVRETCDRHGVLLVLDEVQTGLGRTGRMFAADHEGVRPDVLTVAKALGGGVLPVGAVLCRPDLAGESFSLRHTSTFAGNALGARVGLAVLDELERNGGALVRRAGEAGELLLTGLTALAARYPDVVTDVRGQGLLLGVELSDDLCLTGDQGLIGSMADGENLAMLVCSYLLGVEGIRVAPTLFGARVLRVEPPLTVTDEECHRLLAALDRALGLVAAGDIAGLLGHLVGRPVMTAPARPEGHRPVRPACPPEDGDRRFGFVVHPMDLDSFTDFDPGLRAFDRLERAELLRRMDLSSSVLNPAPFAVGSGRVRSAQGGWAHGVLVGVPYTARQLVDLPPQRAVQVVREAVEQCRDRGAELVGLGAYSSVVTRNGEALGDVGVPVTTGNGFTAGASLRAVRRVALERGIDLATSTATVLGAGGAIGRAVTRGLAPEIGALVLTGRVLDLGSRLGRTAREVVALAAADGVGAFAEAARAAVGSADPVAAMVASGRLTLASDPRQAARGAAVLVAATSAPEPLVTADDLAPDAIVCDVAQPPNIPVDVLERRPDVAVFDGGIVTLPEGSQFRLRYGLPPGLIYACMAETMLLSLSGDTGLLSLGESLTDETVRRLGDLAEHHGFALAPARTWRLQSAVEA